MAATFETILAQYMFDGYIVPIFKIFFPILPQYDPYAALKLKLILRQYSETTNIACAL